MIEKEHKDENRRGDSEEKGVKERVVEDCYVIACEDP